MEYSFETFAQQLYNMEKEKWFKHKNKSSVWQLSDQNYFTKSVLKYFFTHGWNYDPTWKLYSSI